MKTHALTITKKAAAVAALFIFMFFSASAKAGVSSPKKDKLLSKPALVNINGSVSASAKDMNNIDIEVYINGIWAETLHPDANGNFSVKMNLNEIYEVRILHPDYLKESFVVDTHVSLLEFEQMKTRTFFYHTDMLPVKELLSFGLTSVIKEVPFIQYNSDKNCLSYNAELSEQTEVFINSFNAKK
jgi:hypothetical protein